jgi:CBS domain-containing protein
MANSDRPQDSLRVDHVGRTNIYPASGPWPPGDVPMLGQGELAHPEERRGRRQGEGWTSNTAHLSLGSLGFAIAGAYFLYKRDTRATSLCARDVMTADPACCAPQTTLDDVAKLMTYNDCGEIPVVDASDRLVGVITDRDIVCRVVAEGKNPMAYTAETSMSTPVVSVQLGTPLHQVVETMERHQIRRVPVVDAHGCCVGIVSQADVASMGPEHELADLVRKVSRDSDQDLYRMRNTTT